MGRIRRRPSHILKRHRDERDGGEKAQPQKQGPLPYCKRHQFCTANNPSGIHIGEPNVTIVDPDLDTFCVRTEMN